MKRARWAAMRIAVLASLPLLAAASTPDDSRRYMVTGFDRVRIDGPFEVEIVTGSNGASAEGAPAALDRLVVRVQGNTLVVNSGAIGWERRTGDVPQATKVRIAAPLLRGISARGGAQVRVAQMRAARVDVALEGTGSLDVAEIRADEFSAWHNGMGALMLAGTAVRARVNGAVAGTTDARGFIADDASLMWDSSGALTIGVRYTAQISARGLGPVTVLGKPFCTIRGTAPVTCEGKVERR
ncbi:MAG: hypothetical protein EOP59_00845 [Sphingomonadales bacterium]|nr:MAG: hypothetical protein EOP59_00845 [Sphingomonadales bacterium]